LTYKFFKKTCRVLGTTFTKILQVQLDREAYGVQQTWNDPAHLQGGHSSIYYINLYNLKAYLASWNATKVFDHASTIYLDKVTERMAFPQLCQPWMRMLHFNATTRLILPTGLIQEISVSFSCISGDLHCLTQEPMLRMMRKRLIGLTVSNFSQKEEAYMDNIQFLSISKGDQVIFKERA
jgi:hypothetical protein